MIGLSLSPISIARGDYILSSGDRIQVFIYQYRPTKKGIKSLRFRKRKSSIPGIGIIERKIDTELDEDKDDIKYKKKKKRIYLREKDIMIKEEVEEKRGDIIVRPDGKVSIPFIGEIEASGKSIAELDSIITEKLKPYIPNPEVTVMLTGIAGRKNKVYILGEVRRPGLYAVTGEMNLLKALAMAGSVTDEADLSRIYLQRGNKIIPLRAEKLLHKLDLRENIRVYPGDIVYIPRSGIVILNDYIRYYIKPLEFLSLLFGLSDAGRLKEYSLFIGLLYGSKWVFFDTSPYLITSSTNIPLDSKIYKYLDELSFKGLFSTRPLTRNEIDILLRDVGARDNLDEWTRKIIDRLEEEQKKENSIHGYTRAGFYYLDSSDKRQYFDYERDQNWFGHGFNPRVELSFGGDILPKLSYNFSGSMWYNGDKTKIDLKESYLKINFKNLEIEIGRDHLWWGPTYHGSLLLSDNPPPFDLIKLTTRTERFKFTTFLTRLEKERFIPKPYLNGMRFEWLPFENFTLGASRMIMFMGEGRPSLKIGDIPTVLAGENVGGRLETNQLAGLDFSWRLKDLEVYGVWAGEDEAGGMPSAEAYQVGGMLRDIFHSPIDLRIEYAINRKKPHQKATWYEHFIYKSGYRYKGQVIGHHMGSDAQDIFIRLDYNNLPRLKYAFEFDYERHGMIKPVEEREIRYAVEFEYELTPDASIFLRYANWWTRNSNFIEGRKRRDSYIRFEWEYRF